MSPVHRFRLLGALLFAVFFLFIAPVSVLADPGNKARPATYSPRRCPQIEIPSELSGFADDSAKRLASFGDIELRPCYELAAWAPGPGENSAAAATDARAASDVAAHPADQPALRLLPSIKNASPDQEEAILRARLLVLNILRTDNACSVWFRKARPDVDEMFASLTYAIDPAGPAKVTKEVGFRGYWIEHGPYVASTFQGTGPGTTITINANGAFFRWKADLQTIGWQSAAPHRENQWRPIHAGPFDGGTSSAQAVTLLHELAHIVEAIPIDGPSDKGLDRSQSNTEEVVRHCKAAVKEAAKAAH